MLEELKQTKTILMLILIIVAVAAAGVAWWRQQNPSVISKTVFEKIPQIRTVTKVKTVMVPVKEVEALDKSEAVKKLKLSSDIAQDDSKQIITTGEVAPYEGKTEVVTILDTKTGKSEMTAKEVPLPLFGFESKKEIGVRYGYSIKNLQEVDAYGRWDFLRVGHLHVGLYGEMNTAGDGKAMISTGYRW